MRLSVASRTLVFGIAGDLAVEPEHRALGPALLLQRAVVAGVARRGLAGVYGVSNPGAHAAQRRAGFLSVGQAQRLVKPLRSSHLLQKYLGLGATMTALLAPPLDFVMSALAQSLGRRRGRGYELEILQAFDWRFDDLWARVRSRFGVTIERSSEYLSWRFARCPHREYTTLALTERSRLVGYAIWHVEGMAAFVTDLVAIDMGQALEVLLFELLRHLRAQRAQLVSLLYFGEQILVRRLEDLGFIQRTGAQQVVVSLDPEQTPAERMLDATSWYLLEVGTDH